MEKHRQDLLQRLVIVSCLLVLLGTLPGCQVGNTWFQMDSNSPMPFFGFDLLPRRKTSLRESNEAVKTLANSSRPANISPAMQPPVRELHLPRVSDLLKKEQTEEISFEAAGRD